MQSFSPIGHRIASFFPHRLSFSDAILGVRSTCTVLDRGASEEDAKCLVDTAMHVAATHTLDCQWNSGG